METNNLFSRHCNVITLSRVRHCDVFSCGSWRQAGFERTPSDSACDWNVAIRIVFLLPFDKYNQDDEYGLIVNSRSVDWHSPLSVAAVEDGDLGSNHQTRPKRYRQAEQLRTVITDRLRILYLTEVAASIGS
jgi:hypothetical protein